MNNNGTSEHTPAMEVQEDRVAKLKKIACNGTGEFLVIVSQVDPDATGSAVGIADVLRHIRRAPIHVRIGYSGSISHPQNLILFNECGLDRDITRLEHMEIAEKTCVVLVDAISLNDNRVPKKVQVLVPAVIIDHHLGDIPADDDGHLHWVENIGSSCTLVTELIQATGTPLKKETALLLALGIYTDTKGLINAERRDRHAFDFVIEVANREQFQKLASYDLPKRFFDLLNNALTNRIQKDNRLLSRVGCIKSGEEDYLAIIADLLLRSEAVEIVFVWGILVDEEGKMTTVVKARSLLPRINLNQLIQAKFGSGGAKFMAGGRSEGGTLAKLDIGRWGKIDLLEKIEELESQWMQLMIFTD